MFDLANLSSTEPILLNKPVGLTPLQAVQEFARQQQIDPTLKLGFAGRLDPLADGLLLALVGAANKQQSRLLELDKTYAFTAVFGLTTDSFDLMGLPQLGAAGSLIDMNTWLPEFIGARPQPYPIYSAVQVKGKPLYWWARAGRLDEIAIPEAIRHIYTLSCLDTGWINSQELLSLIEHKIGLVQGNFRQVEIVESWRRLLRKSDCRWPTAEFEVSCSSGTYIRGLVNQFGQRLGSGATALSITRTAVGPYRLVDATRLAGYQSE